MLLKVATEAPNGLTIYGQEKDIATKSLSIMNMWLHGSPTAEIASGNTLANPKFKEKNGSLKRFDFVVANPPFSAQWSANNLFMSDERFSQYGKLAPKSKADYAFVTHMIHHLDDNGTLAVVLPHGALFRGGAEGHIRKYLIREKNYLDAVIGLPANIFFGTGIPTSIMVFKKYRKTKEVLFIDASEHYEKVGKQNVLREEHIDKIISTYTSRNTEDKYSYLASSEELIENEYNLNIPRYVDTFEEEEPVDLDRVSSELKSLENDISDTDKTISDFCDELNIKPPF